MRFEELDEAQKRDFRKRLAGLDLDESALIADELVVGRGMTMELSLAPGGHVEPRRLVTKDLDTVRRWIGTDVIKRDPKVQNPLRRFPELAELGGGEVSGRRDPREGPVGGDAVREVLSKIEAGPLADRVKMFRGADRTERRRVRPSSQELAVLQAAAYMHVRGDKEILAEYRPAAELFFKQFEIAAWVFTEIRVKAGAVLQFGQGANVCKAWRVVLEPGAKIRSYGHLTVDCTKLERQHFKLPLPDHIRPRPIIDRRRPR